MANRQKPRGKTPILVLAAILLGLVGASVSRNTPYVGQILGNERPLGAMVMEGLRGLAVAPAATPRVVVFLLPPEPAPPQEPEVPTVPTAVASPPKEPETPTVLAPPPVAPVSEAPAVEASLAPPRVEAASQVAPRISAADKVVARLAAELKKPSLAAVRPKVENPPWPAAESSTPQTRPVPMTEEEAVDRIAARRGIQAPPAETAATTPVPPPKAPPDALRRDVEPVEKPPKMAVDETVEIARRTNLRARPDTASEIIATLKPGIRVKVLESRTRQGYYHVLHTTGTGWIWWRNIASSPVGAAGKLAAGPGKTAKTKWDRQETLAPVAAAKSVSDPEARPEARTELGPDEQIEAVRKLINRIRSTKPPASSPVTVMPPPAKTEKAEAPLPGGTQAPDPTPDSSQDSIRTSEQVAAVPVPSVEPRQVFVEPVTGVLPGLRPGSRPGPQSAVPGDPENEQVQRLLGMVEGGTQEARFRVAAEDGRVAAQYNLGVLYYLGQDVPQDYARAAKWFRRAADQGDPDSQYNLGILYYRGLGVPRNLKQAFVWIDRAAEQGQSEAIKARRSITAQLPAGTVNESAERNIKER